MELPVQAFDEVLGLTGAGEIVVFARKDDELRGNAIMLERSKPLFALFQGNAIVVVGVKNQRGSADVACVLQR